MLLCWSGSGVVATMKDIEGFMRELKQLQERYGVELYENGYESDLGIYDRGNNERLATVLDLQDGSVEYHIDSRYGPEMIHDTRGIVGGGMSFDAVSEALRAYYMPRLQEILEETPLISKIAFKEPMNDRREDEKETIAEVRRFNGIGRSKQ